MLRFASALVLLSVSALPSLAQDRTPPAGSYRALSVPSDVNAATSYEAYGVRQGRSDAIDRAPAHRTAR